MSQEPFDHAYAFGVSNHVKTAVVSGSIETELVNNKTIEKVIENTENDTFSEGNEPEFNATEKVLVESVNAPDLSAIHEKLVKGSPNKSWYLNGKSADKRHDSVSSSSTETCDSEVEQMDVDKDIDQENGEVEKDEIDGANNREEENKSVSPTESTDYTPMSPVPMEEESAQPTEAGKLIGENLLKEIVNEQKPDETQSDKDMTGGDKIEKLEKSSSSQKPQMNGFADHEYAKGDILDQIENDHDKDNDGDEETDIEGHGQEQDLNETDLNVTENSEVNGSLDVSQSSEGVQNDTLDPGSEQTEQRLVSPLLMVRKGRPRGRGRGRGKHRRWSQGWTRISPRKRSVDFIGSLGDAGKSIFLKKNE